MPNQYPLTKHMDPTYSTPTEDALDAAARNSVASYKKCGVYVAQLIQATRTALRLHSSTKPSAVTVLGAGTFNKAFFIQFGSIATVVRVPLDDLPAARDPIRLKSQIATLDFLKVHRSNVPVPRVLTAVLTGDNPAGAPYTISEFSRGTPLRTQEWLDMTEAKRSSLIDLLADYWVRIAAPTPFNTIGSIICDSADFSLQSWGSSGGGVSRDFRTMPMILQFPTVETECLDPSMEHRAGPTNLAEHWRYLIDLRRREISRLYPDCDHSVIVKDGIRNNYTLGKLMQCVDAVQHLADVAASMDPFEGKPMMALMHVDFACWRNVLLSEDRERIEGIVDWDDAVVVPRDLAALYPLELTLSASCRYDPEDVYVVPPGTLYEDTGLWETKIEETRRRERFREAVRKVDPEFAALYTDRRARFRRHVNNLLIRTWRALLWNEDWLLSTGLEEARALTSAWRA
ncbi:hypothetical protein DAEQUDRAFT_770252 [Daedalea quercina L-15889]|uniref:Aminoglycoside phosphotransferase domain-containing protein n=1 Tax=Daedalea quercina L-15889 TaxID=1314783 RepID=A0A165L001_9APHY|nr:hypothetical protein DAEQUDRAFT_770252 [Daedalea quercina L-15889]